MNRASGETSEASSRPQRVLLPTLDGSLSLKDEISGELYHNRAGAYSEAWLNYVEPSAALPRLLRQKEISVLDACFGLGYNSFVLIEQALQQKLLGRIHIRGIDSDAGLLELLPAIFETETELKKHLDIKQLQEQRRCHFIYEGLELEMRLLVNSLRGPQLWSEGSVDFIYHDPFSPHRMPELWTVDIFRQYHAMLQAKKGAILTYSSASAIRAGLSEVGFTVKRTAALGGKSGGTIGMISSKSEEFICTDLSEDEMLRMAGSSGVPYRDPGFSLERQELLANRQIEQKQRKQGLSAKPAG